MTLPNSDVVEELIWKIVVRSEQGLKEIKAFREQVDAMKAELKRLASETGQSVDAVAAAMRRSWGDETQRQITQLKEKIKAAKEEIRKFTQEMRRPETIGRPVPVISADLDRARGDLLNYQQQLVKISNQSKATGAIASQALREIRAETKSAAQTLKVFGIELGNLNNIARVLFGVTLLSLAGQALRSLISWLKEAADQGVKLSQSVFALETGVRALRRAGAEITTAEVLDNLQRINEATGNLYSQLELIAGAAELTNLIRDLGLTREQIFNLQEAVIKLAIINGRAMDDVQRTVALALSSGYTEGLQRLGVSINRLTIAEEANRIGFEGGYTALSEQARALATYNLIVQKTAIYSDDLASAQSRLFGALRSTEAQIQDANTAIGEALAPITLLTKKIELLAIKLFSLVPIINSVLVIQRLASVMKVLPAVWEQAGKSAESFAERLGIILDFARKVSDAINKFKPIEPVFAEFLSFGGEDVEVGERAITQAQERILSTLEDFQNEIEQIEENVAERRKRIEKDLQDDLAEITRDGVGDRLRIEQDYQGDLLEIERDASARREKLARNLQQRLKEIDLKLEFDLSEAQIRFDFDVQEAIIQFNQAVAKANQDYRQKELERERKFNEEMLQIREDFLMDLEDALRERDAKAVLRSIRQYNLEKARAEREDDLNKIRNKEALQEELTAAAQRREARIRELEFELAQRREALARQAEFERAEAQRRYEQELEELRQALERENYERYIKYLEQKRDQEDREKAERIRRLLKYEEEKEELRAFEDEKLKIIGDHLAQQAMMMELSSKEVLAVIEGYFGKGGLALKIFQAYVDAVEQMLRQLRTIPWPRFDRENIVPQPKLKPQGFAEGGAVIANQPTTAVFGEAGPELALFIPVNQMDKMSSFMGSFLGGQVQPAAGSVTIRVGLEPGLMADIVDKSINTVADVILEVQRRAL